MSTVQGGHSSSLILGEGPAPCVAMIIGMNPGEEEARQGRPFVGPSGQLLVEALNLAGADRSQVYITNVYKSRTPKNRVPTMEEAEEHYDYLRDEFTAVQPIGVLLLGSFAMEALTGETGITKLRGSQLPGGFRADWFLPTYHPSYVLRNSGTLIEADFLDDVAEFVDLTLNLAR